MRLSRSISLTLMMMPKNLHLKENNSELHKESNRWVAYGIKQVSCTKNRTGELQMELNRWVVQRIEWARCTKNWTGKMHWFEQVSHTESNGQVAHWIEQTSCTLNQTDKLHTESYRWVSTETYRRVALNQAGESHWIKQASRTESSRRVTNGMKRVIHRIEQVSQTHNRTDKSHTESIGQLHTLDCRTLKWVICQLNQTGLSLTESNW